MRTAMQSLNAQRSARCEIRLSDTGSERFSRFSKRLIDANPSPVYVWTPRTMDCGALLVASLAASKFDFGFSVNDEGILALTTSDLIHGLLLEFSSAPKGEQVMTLETQGTNWISVIYWLDLHESRTHGSKAKIRSTVISLALFQGRKLTVSDVGQQLPKIDVFGECSIINKIRRAPLHSAAFVLAELSHVLFIELLTASGERIRRRLPDSSLRIPSFSHASSCSHKSAAAMPRSSIEQTAPFGMRAAKT